MMVEGKLYPSLAYPASPKNMVLEILEKKSKHTARVGWI